MRFNKELLEKYRIDVSLELNDIMDYLGCDADICLDKEVERMFEDIPKTEEIFLMSIGNTLWDLLRKRIGKDCPRCLSDDLNYVLAETKKENCFGMQYLWLDRVFKWKGMGRRKN